MAPVTKRKRLAGLLMSTCIWLTLSNPASAEYVLGPGDTLNLTVAGVPELATKAQIDIDGNVTFPLVGQLPVAGLSVASVLAKIQAGLPGKEFRRRSADGREFPVIIAPSEIGVSVLDYRPVYLNGDVGKPGRQTYIPDMTVRAAIALAGGFDVLRFKMDNPFLQLSDLTSEYNSLWIDYAKEFSATARLQAELDGKQDFDANAAVRDLPVAPSLAKEIANNQRNLLAVRNQDFAKEKAYLKQAALKEADRTDLLSEQQSKEQEGVDADTADLERYTAAFKQGSVILPRLSEARRNLLASSTRVLQTISLIASVDREHQDLSRRLDRLGDSRRMQLLKELGDATTRLATVRAKLQAASDKLRYTGMVKSQLVRGTDSNPDIVIVRNTGGRQTKLVGTVDTKLQPGDVVEVALQVEKPNF